MQYAISAGAIVVRGGCLLLVHHRADGYDFWLPPGGRLRGEESILECAARETREETGLAVVPGRIVYVEEFVELDLHFCKFWVLARDPGGAVSTAGRDPDEVHLVDARFVSRRELSTLKAFPRILHDVFWEDLANGFTETRYLGLQSV
ncbi:MAG: NUDIX hydrolase [Candidatus Bipolaricaulota bacterium]|nr:NUDIX hydrolase [Candidatus Bipolaricaulota bacterium]